MKISVIVVTFNSSSDIGRAIDSVLAQKLTDPEIIVVDNGSCDSTIEVLRNNYPQIRLICNGRNLGAAAARNQAIQQTSGEWILMLDSDAYLKEDFLRSFQRFIENLKSKSRVGIITTKILYPDNRTIYGIGDRLTFLRRFYEIGHHCPDRGQFDSSLVTFGGCSAAAFYRRDMLSEIKDGPSGYFDEDFFYMAEDVDLAWRARKKGWEACVCQNCIAYHAGNGSKTSISQKKYYSIRNRFLLMFKNETLFYLIAFCLPLLMYEIVRLIYLTLKGEGRVYRSAVRSAFVLIKKQIKERCGVMKKRIALVAVLLISLLICRMAFCLEEYKTDADEAAAYNVTRSVKTVDGLNFRVEEDRPIEKVGGVYRPIDVDSYIALKFNKLEKKINEITINLQNKIDVLSKRLDTLGNKVEDLSLKVRDLSGKVEVLSANQAGFGNQTAGTR